MPRTKDESYEAFLSLVSRAVWRQLDVPAVRDEESGELLEPSQDYYVLCTFEDAVLVENCSTQTKYEVPFFLNGSDVVFGAMREVEEMYVQKRAAEAGVRIRQIATKPTS